MWTFCYVFIRKQWFQRQKSLSNYKGNLGKVHIRPTKYWITFFLGKILHRGFFYSIRILPFFKTSKNELPSIILDIECRAKYVRYPPSRTSISNRLHIVMFFFRVMGGWQYWLRWKFRVDKILKSFRKSLSRHNFSRRFHFSHFQRPIRMSYHRSRAVWKNALFFCQNFRISAINRIIWGHKNASYSCI